MPDSVRPRTPVVPGTMVGGLARLHRLRQCIAEYGPLDSVRGPAEVNVRHELAIKLRTVKKPQAVKQAAKEHSEDAAVVK